VIFETLSILSEEVDSYLGGGVVAIENITAVDDPSEGNGNSVVSDKVVMTLLNIEEEKTLKNFPNSALKNGKIQYKNPRVNVNLFVLFSANRSSYTKSLSDVSKVIEFFQGKRVFTQANTIYKRQVPLDNVGNFHFTADLYTPTFEELNFIWGTLGGRQLPSVLYKLSIIEIERGNVVGESGPISESISNSNSL